MSSTLKEQFEQLVGTPSTYESFLRPTWVEGTEGKITLQVIVRPEHQNLLGVVHGGVFAGICDVAMAVAALSVRRHIVTTEMNISYLRNVSVGSTVTIHAYVLNAGRQLVRTRCEIIDEQHTLLVSASGTFFSTHSTNEK